ncbi:MAG TPA: cyclic peptide export ABC transporter [Duganella sp.]|nr:cyclic peptide export ABC transporter [Duganella sp.]
MPSPLTEDSLQRGQFHFLLTRAPNRVFISILAAIAGGIAHALLIPLLLISITPADPLLVDFIPAGKWMLGPWEITHPRFALAFLVLCALVVVSKAMAQNIFGAVLVEAASALRLFFAERIRRLPIEQLERIGSARLVTAINVDIASLVEGAASLPVMLINASTIIGALAYIAFLHEKIFWLVLAVIVAGVASYRLPLVFGERYFSKARPLRDAIQESVTAQVLGAKELRLNAARYSEFMTQGMQQDERLTVRLLNKGYTVFHLAIQYGNVIGFLAIGAVAYGATGRYDLAPALLVSVVMAMLYVIGPIGVIVNSVPQLIQGAVALRQLRLLLADMPCEQLVEAGGALPCEQVQLDQVAYRYAGQDGFGVGPLSLTLAAGQVTFLIGGNGSGKSTLAKIISCHYTTSVGALRFDGTAITAANLYQARQNISAIYLDFYLFTRLYGLSPAALARAPAYLERLGLAHKVTLEHGRLSTVSLSAGQRKRLALLVALLEDRQLYVFDEWAADQDPEFKHSFYTGVLDELRQRGKVVLVISHDDRYFDQADQLVWMEHGKLVRIERQRRPQPAPQDELSGA